MLAFATGLLAALTMGGGIASLLRGRWFDAATSPLYALGGYWLTVGAYRRTVWGQPSRENESPPDPPSLSATRARLYIVVAAACVVAAGVALTVQVVEARW